MTTHKISIQSKTGSNITIETNNIDEVFNKNWFQKFINEDTQQQTTQTTTPNDDWKDIAQEQKNQLRTLSKELREMKQYAYELQQRGEERKKQEEIQLQKNAAMQQQQPQAQAQQQQTAQHIQQAQGKPTQTQEQKPAYLETTPNNMTRETWEAMNPEQQTHWKKHYNIQ